MQRTVLRLPLRRPRLALPIATWEFSVGIYMIVKGFRDVSDATETSVSAAPAVSPVLAQV